MNDAALLERWVQRQDAEAFNEIVSRFADQVYATCRNILRNDADAEEVAQECFLLLVRSGDDVRASLGGWLHRVATTKSLDRIRSEARRRKYEQAHAGDVPHHTEATWDDIQEHVDAAIDTLPEELREAVVAHFIGRRTHLEIALELHLTRRAVSYRIQRGVDALRAELVRRGVTVSCAGLGALLLADATTAAPLSLKASLGKLALAAGLPPSSGASAAAAVKTAGSLILMKTKLIVAAALVCAATGIYLATRPGGSEQPPATLAEVPTTTPQGEAPSPASAAAPPKAVLTSAASLEPAEPAAVTEEHRGVVMGVVLLPTGLPASGATVRYAWEPNSREVPVDGMTAHSSEPIKTDENGLFAFARVPRGRIGVTATHDEGLVSEQVTVDSRGLRHDLTLVLKGGETITGVVVTREGQGIAGARIVPLQQDGQDLRSYESKGREVISDQDGNFAMPHLRRGQWTLRAVAEGFGAEMAGPFETGPALARILLTPGVELACRAVLTSDQTPIEGVEVALKYQDQQTAFMTTKSDGQGAALFGALGKGNYTLDVKHPRYALAGPPVSVGIDPARKVPPLTLELVEGGQIRGRVVDASSSDGIGNVIIRARESATGRSYSSTPTDDSGSYTIAGLPSGEYSLAPVKLPPAYSRDLQDTRQLTTVSEGQTIDSVDFSIAPGAAFGGIVRDSKGVPVAGAQVSVKVELGNVVIGDLYTQEDGRFAVGDFKAGDSVVLSAQSRTANSGRLGPFVVGDPGNENLELVLSRESTGVIAGRVTDPQGKPYPCQLMAVAEEPHLQFPVMWRTGETDGKGNFVLSGFCAGTYTIEIVPERTARQKSDPINVEAGQLVSNINLVYDPGERFEIAGVVVDEEENPVAGVRVTVRGSFPSTIPSETTDESGAFHFRDLPAGTYAIEPSAKGYYGQQSVGVAEAGEMNATVMLIRASNALGRVVDGQGKPVTNFLAAFYRLGEDPSDVPLLQQRFSDPNGDFVLEFPDNGKWLLRVEAEGYKPAEVELDSAILGRDVENVSVTLEARK